MTLECFKSLIVVIEISHIHDPSVRCASSASTHPGARPRPSASSAPLVRCAPSASISLVRVHSSGALLPRPSASSASTHPVRSFRVHQPRPRPLIRLRSFRVHQPRPRPLIRCAPSASISLVRVHSSGALLPRPSASSASTHPVRSFRVHQPRPRPLIRCGSFRVHQPRPRPASSPMIHRRCYQRI